MKTDEAAAAGESEHVPDETTAAGESEHVPHWMCVIKANFDEQISCLHSGRAPIVQKDSTPPNRDENRHY